MRRKSMQNSGGKQHHNNGGGHNSGHGGGSQRRNSGGSYGNNNNRPRKNYSQLREKYLGQARDSLSSGDRVMAEYYFQHADHCYRMMMEDGYRPRSNHTNSNEQNSSEQAAGEQNGREQYAANNSPPIAAAEYLAPATSSTVEEVLNVNPSALPSFITMGYAAEAKQNNEQQEITPQNWEEN